MGKEITNRIGEENYNKFGSKMIITRYNKWNDMDIYFPEYDWTFKNARYEHFKNGTVKCPYEPRFFGIGYLGEGKYKMSKGKGNDIKCQRAWMDMLRRCYDENSRHKNQSYKDCDVCEEWLNYQNFAEWYYNNIYFVGEEKMHLDKDILYKGNKIYSPQTCIFTPQKINDLFTKGDKIRGNLPIGVALEQHRFKTSYRASCTNGNRNQIYLGCLDTPHEAFLLYKLNKELVIQSIAEEYKDKIPNKLYEALMNYKVEEND